MLWRDLGDCATLLIQYYPQKAYKIRVVRNQEFLYTVYIYDNKDKNKRVMINVRLNPRICVEQKETKK